MKFDLYEVTKKRGGVNSRIILIVIMSVLLIACHKEKTLERSMSDYFRMQNVVTQHGQQVLTKYFSAYKQKLVDRNIAEIICLPTKKMSVIHGILNARSPPLTKR